MTSIHDAVGLRAAFRSLGLDPELLRRFRNAFLKHGAGAEEALAALPPEHRERVAAEVAAHSLRIVETRASGVDAATKLLFATHRGEPLEAVVLRPRSGRTSLCISAQSGCAARCVFCATGTMPAVANLSRDEILDQVVRANQLLRAEGRSVRNVVFMGMGEPFHNEAAVHEALDALLAPDAFDFAPRRVAVSTVGIPDAMRRFTRRRPGVLLAVSLHAARQEVRESIVPIAKVHGLDELRGALEDASSRLEHGVMIEYLLLDGVNDSSEDEEALVGFLDGLRVHVNLIPYNAIDGAPGLQGTPEPRRREIACALRARGFQVTLRYSLGADIGAACGQLARKVSQAVAGASPAAAGSSP